MKTPIPVPVNLNDDRFVVVRNHALKADDAAGKNKDANLHGVLANDELPTGKLYEVDLVAKPQFGAFKLNRDGTFLYASAARPGGEFVRFDSFKYRVRASNHDPWSEPANVTIAIHPYSDEELAAVKRIGSIYGEASIRMEQNPPAVQIDFSEPIVHKLGSRRSRSTIWMDLLRFCTSFDSIPSRSLTAASTTSRDLSSCKFSL